MVDIKSTLETINTGENLVRQAKELNTLHDATNSSRFLSSIQNLPRDQLLLAYENSSYGKILRLKEHDATPTVPKTAQTRLNAPKHINAVADIGLAVRVARKSKSLTQQNFADLAGVGRRFLSELESGKPTLEIGKVLQVATAAGLQLTIVNNSDE